MTVTDHENHCWLPIKLNLYLAHQMSEMLLVVGSVNPISTRMGRLCPSHYYQPPPFGPTPLFGDRRGFKPPQLKTKQTKYCQTLFELRYICEEQWCALYSSKYTFIVEKKSMVLDTLVIALNSMDLVLSLSPWGYIM